MIMVISPRLGDEPIEVTVSILVLREDRKVILPLAAMFVDRAGICL